MKKLLLILSFLPLFSLAQGPTANFLADTTCCGDPADFMNLSIAGSSPIVSCNWDFGDGANSSNFSPMHIYWNGGSYLVTLTVVDSNGNTDSYSIWKYVHCFPTSNFIWSPVPACVGLPICFTDSSASFTSTIPITQWFWDMGGFGIYITPTSSWSQNPVYAYSNAGFYSVTLTVTDNWGCSGDTTIMVQVDTCSTSCTSTGLNNYTTSRELLKVTNILGKDTKPKSNIILFYIYSDGTVEKKIIIE